MPIINMMSNNADSYPQGAYCIWDRHIHQRNGKGIVLYESHHGLCLFEREMNGYDDSDFYMTVWDEENGCAKEIMFATTRGWTYPCYGSRPDASEEVWAKYREWKERMERENEELRLRQFRNKLWDTKRRFRRLEQEVAILYDFPQGRIIRLRKGFGGQLAMRCSEDADYEAVLNLLINKRIRSNFKLSLRRQVIEWMRDPSQKYNRPLSPKQLAYI